MARLLSFFTHLKQEVWAVRAQVARLHRPFWRAYRIAWLTLLVGLLPLSLLVPFTGALVLVIGVLALGPEWLLPHLERRGWVEPDADPDAGRRLNLLLTALAIPLFVVGCALWFWQIAWCFPSVLPWEGWFAPLLLGWDNFTQSQLFLGFVEAFGLQLATPPTSRSGCFLLFMTRLVLDLALLRLAIDLIRPAWFRSAGLATGEETLAALRAAVRAGNSAEVARHSQALGATLRQAVQALRERLNGPQSEHAWEGLKALRGYAVPHLQDLLAAARSDEERQELNHLIQALENPQPLPPIPTLTWQELAGKLLQVCGWGFLALVGVNCFGLVTMLLALPAALRYRHLPLVLWVVALTALLLVPRRWLDLLVERRWLDSIDPEHTGTAVLLWRGFWWVALVVGLCAWSVSAIHQATGMVDLPRGVGHALSDYVCRIQVFCDFFTVHASPPSQPLSFGERLEVWVVQLLLDAAAVATLVGSVWPLALQWTRGDRGLPYADLALVREARVLGPHAPALIQRHYESICDHLELCMKDCATKPEVGELLLAGLRG